MVLEVKAEGVDGESLRGEIRRRVEERRAALYTEEELRQVAERPFRGVPTAHEVGSSFLEEFRRRDASWNFSFDERTLVRSSHGRAGRALEGLRRVLAPVQKLLWNRNPLVAALSRQADLNRSSVVLLHNLVRELTRLHLEVLELRSRHLELGGRLEELLRREKTLEGMAAYREEGEKPAREG